MWVCLWQLYMWRYKETGEQGVPTIALRTRRSLRAVHFHPGGAPLLLSAEVNDAETTQENPPPMAITTLPSAGESWSLNPKP